MVTSQRHRSAPAADDAKEAAPPRALTLSVLVPLASQRSKLPVALAPMALAFGPHTGGACPKSSSSVYMTRETACPGLAVGSVSEQPVAPWALVEARNRSVLTPLSM